MRGSTTTPILAGSTTKYSLPCLYVSMRSPSLSVRYVISSSVNSAVNEIIIIVLLSVRYVISSSVYSAVNAIIIIVLLSVRYVISSSVNSAVNNDNGILFVVNQTIQHV